MTKIFAAKNAGGSNKPNGLTLLQQFCLGWFAVYFITGAVAVSQGTTSFFASTVDDVSSIWISLIFLNVPAQLITVIISLLLAQHEGLANRRLSNVFAMIATIMISAHIVISTIVNLT